ncbi:dual specificity phosphatase, catalytic domain protein, partial [Vibrio parahaemolyticus V-223/04]
EVATS